MDRKLSGIKLSYVLPFYVDLAALMRKRWLENANIFTIVFDPWRKTSFQKAKHDVFMVIALKLNKIQVPVVTASSHSDHGFCNIVLQVLHRVNKPPSLGLL